MTQAQAQKWLPLIQALAEGKKIQYNFRNQGWHDAIEPSFLDDDTEYRLKPEPRRIFINQYGNILASRYHNSKAEAINGGYGYNTDNNIVEFVEVLKQ